MKIFGIGLLSNRNMDIGNTVLITTDAIYQPTQTPLNGYKGIVAKINNDNDIQVVLWLKNSRVIISFSKEELIIES